MTKSPEEFSQLYLHFTDPIQFDYEVIRPVVLFAEPIAKRSRDTEIPRATVSNKAKQFVQAGMLGLIDGRTQRSNNRPHGFPEPVARYIHYLKHLYPPISYREITRIVASKFGYPCSHGKVKRFLQTNPIVIQLALDFKTFHEFEDAYEARWTVVRMFHEGWNKKSIAAVLKLARSHVTTLIQEFEQDGFDALEDKRTRPAAHPHNQMTLPFIDDVFKIQLHYPDAGRFRVHGMLEPKYGDDLPSKRTVGRAMQNNRLWRGAPNPLQDSQKSNNEPPAELPYKPLFHHQYWFIDIRYLVKFEGKWVYSICIIEGVSRTILAGMASRYQDEIAILQLLHAALGEFGLPWGIVSDNGSQFRADAYLDVLDDLEIQPCPIEKKQPWQNLIEAQFNIQRRLGDHKFKQAETFEEIEDQHAAFIQLFNTTRHWTHRKRMDDKLTPIAVLDGQLGRATKQQQLQQAFRHLQYSRVINQHGLVSVQRFYIYAERGLARRRVTIWIYQNRLNIAYEDTLLARYTCKLDRPLNRLKSVSTPSLYTTPFASPQQELFTLDDAQWLKVMQRPPYLSRNRILVSNSRQLPLFPLQVAFWVCVLFLK